MVIGLALHTLAAIVWIGGMFFAHMVLRPSAAPLEPAARFQLWHRVFSGFFPWVWLSVTVLLLSGFGMVLLGLGGFRLARLYIHLMAGLGLMMTANYVFLYFVLWARFCRAVEAADWQFAPARLASIRRLVTVNLILGLVTAIVASGGRYYG